ncbi:MAG TPA: DNA polymerase III subunit beta [Phycisphaerae bacterium]|jgi:DNA polymerase-3 subunit beta|nr:DNA polymerase III subunit beta [Phycisphaerae bacterium]
MKLLVNRAALVEALGLASSVVLARTPKPVLTCVKLVANNTGSGPKTLTVVATDMELALQYTLTQVDIATPGVALIPAGKLSEIVNNSPDDTLTLETNADTTVIKGSDAHYKVFGYNPEEFPPVSSFDGEPDFSLSAGSLRTLLDRTRFAAAREMTRYAINGVLFEKKGKKLLLVATDGHRLAQTRDDTIGEEGGKDVSAVVPIKAINLIERLLTDPEQTVSLQFKENKLFVQVGGGSTDAGGGVTATMSTSLVEGTFPPYGDVIPKDSDKKVTLNRDRFFSAVRRAALLTNEESKGVRLAFSGGTLSISSRAPEMGEAKIDLPVEYGGEALEIGFNPTYLLDALKVADQETVTFEMKTPNKPGLLRSGPGFLYVVMPVNLS